MNILDSYWIAKEFFISTHKTLSETDPMFSCQTSIIPNIFFNHDYITLKANSSKKTRIFKNMETEWHTLKQVWLQRVYKNGIIKIPWEEQKSRNNLLRFRRFCRPDWTMTSNLLSIWGAEAAWVEFQCAVAALERL